MKRLWLILPVILIVGCSSPEPINYETTLVQRDGVFYTKDTNEPYSGPVFSLYDDGKKKVELTLKDGKVDGLLTGWYENGQKRGEMTYKDGKEDGLHTEWYKNGQKWYEKTYKDGEWDGLFTEWYENGQKREERTYKDGELISSKCWDEAGNEIECY